MKYNLGHEMFHLRFPTPPTNGISLIKLRTMKWALTLITVKEVQELIFEKCLKYYNFYYNFLKKFM
jgi:hypothetical protein